MPGAVPVALLLAVATLQLQSACGRSPWTEADQLARVQATTANSLIQAVEQYFKNGLNTLQGSTSMCDHLQRVLSKLCAGGRLHLSTTGPPHADNSCLNADESYWDSASTQTRGVFSGYSSAKKSDNTYIQEDRVLYATVDNGKTLSITNIPFPVQTSTLPHNNVLNMTFNCATGQLDVHTRVSDEVEIIPHLLSLCNPILSIRIGVGSHIILKTVVLSTNTQMFSLETFVAVRYNNEMSISEIKGIPTDTSSIGQIPNLRESLNSLPKTLADLLSSKVKVFNYNRQIKELVLHTTLTHITLIPDVLRLVSVTISVDALTGPSPTIKHLTFTGTWKIGTARLNTEVLYNRAKKIIHVTSSPAGSSSLNIEAIMKNIAGISHNVPSQLTSLFLSNVVGNIYSNGRYFVVISGSISGGNMYLLFYKGSSGVKVGISASVDNFHLSNLVKSATGVDITSVPYFGSLVVPAMAIAITSGTIQNPTLPHLFGKGSPLLSYNDTLPAGVTSQFHLDIGKARGTVANFARGVITIKFSKSVDMNVQSLASHIPGISDAIQALPSQMTSILNARVASFSFNSTSKDLSISGFLNHFTLVSGFLSISNVQIFYDGVLGNKMTTRSLNFIGTWQISDYSILTSITYDGVEKQLTVSSQSQGGKQLSIENVLESLAGTTVPLPSAISSFTFTRISGKVAQGTAIVILSGMVGKGRISAVFEKSTSVSAGAVVVDITSFDLAELIWSATGIDISSIPFFGPMVIPELKFTVATNSITSPLLAGLVGTGSPLEEYKNGIVKGASGRFSIQIGEVTGIAVKFIHKKLFFTVPDISSLPLETVLSTMPSIKDLIQNLPPQLSSILSSEVTSFSYDPTTKELHLSGSMEKELNITLQVAPLSNVKFSLDVVLGLPTFVKTLSFTGDWTLVGKLPIHTTVSYNREEKRLDITGELNSGNSGINIRELVTSLSGQDLPIPSVLSSVTLKKLSGNKIGDVILVTLSGTVGQGNIHLIYQKSPSGSAIAFAADIPKFRFSSLVSSTTSIDISDAPYFGTLVIPRIGFTISSNHINNPLLSGLYSASSPLTNFGDVISKGVNAEFGVNLRNIQGIIADYREGDLYLRVPDSVDLSMKTILKLIPGLQEVINFLPPTLQDVASARMHRIAFSASTRELQLSGSLTSLTIVPDFLSLQNIAFEFFAIVGANSRVKCANFKGDWVINSLALTTDITYMYENTLLIKGFPQNSKTLNIKSFIEDVAGTELNIPSLLSVLQFTQMIGKVQDETTSIVFLGQTGNKDKVSIVYQRSGKKIVVAFAGDLLEFKLAELVKAGTRVDISSVPFFGTFTIPALSFVISSKQFSTALLPDLNIPDVPKELLQETIPEGVKGQFLADIATGNGIVVDYSRNILTLEVPSSTAFSLQDLLSVIPEIKSTIDTLPSRLKDILNAKITQLVFKPATKSLFLNLSLETLTLVPKMASMKNVKISFQVSMDKQTSQKRQAPISPTLTPFQLHSPIVSASKQVAEIQATHVEYLQMEGIWVIRGIETDVVVSYDKDTKQIHIEGNPTSSRSKSPFAVPKQGLNIRNLINSLTEKSLPIPSVISSISLTKIIGQISANVFTFIFSGSIAGKADVHLVYQKFGTTSHIAIAAGINSFTFADLVQSAVNIDISGIPFFGTFSVPSLGLAISSGKLTVLPLSQILPQNSPLTKFGNTFPRGFTAKFNMPIHNIQGVIGAYADKVLSFTVPPNVDVSLKALLSIVPGVNVALPPVLGDILTRRPSVFSFDIQKREMNIEIFVEKINFYENMLTMTNTQLKLKAKLPTAKSFSAEAKGIIILGNADYAVDFKKDPRRGKYLISVETEKLPIFDLLTQIGARMLPDDLNRILGQVFNFNILNARVVYPLDVQPQQILISGTPQIFGLKTTHMTAVAIRYGGKIHLIQKYNLGTFNIADFLRKLFRVSLHKLKLLNQNVDIGFVISPTTLKGISLPSDCDSDAFCAVAKKLSSIPEFREPSIINKGISFNIPLGWPPDCESDAFCAVAKKLLGGVKLSLQATIDNAQSFSMTATIGNLKLGGGVVLMHAGLQIVSGNNPSVEVVGGITLKKPAISLTAAIRASAGGVKLEGAMSGCWNNAFGSPYLTICNLLLAMSIVPSSSPISGLEIGGRVEVGKKSCDRVLTAEGYIGINEVNPNKNYLYAHFGPITFQKFFDAFCLSVHLPRPLAESGFPEGFTASFSLLGKELPHARISIPPGYRFKGKLHILGLDTDADIIVQLPTRISVKAALPPLRIANIFKMYASEKDRSRGPYLAADISVRKAPSIDASGFVEVLGMSKETKLLITTSMYEFHINGKFLKHFDAELHITASYGNFSEANFVVEGWFKDDDLFDKIATIFRDGLKKSKEFVRGWVCCGKAFRKCPCRFPFKSIFDSAKRHLSGRYETVKRRVKKATKALRNYASTKIINIREMYFKAGLSVANGGKFKCRIQVEFMGKKKDINLNFDVHNIQSIAKALAEQAFGISKFIG